MPTVSYNTNIPDAPNNPSTDQPKMKVNTNAVDTLVQVDHYSFNNLLGGYHKAVHIIADASNPANVATVPRNGIVFTKEYTPPGGSADTQLYYKTAVGGVSQLTGNSDTTNGYQWIGGQLIQWGRVTGLAGAWPTTDQTLSFTSPNIPFTNLRAVLLTFIGPTTSSTGEIIVNSVNPGNFHWQFTGSTSAGFNGFFWFAIGS